jgi:hypothetical protein
MRWRTRQWRGSRELGVALGVLVHGMPVGGDPGLDLLRVPDASAAQFGDGIGEALAAGDLVGAGSGDAAKGAPDLLGSPESSLPHHALTLGVGRSSRLGYTVD